MQCIFVTREPEVCSLMATRVQSETVRCSVKTDFLTFFLQLQKNAITCDLLVCDFRLFQHMLSDVVQSLQQLTTPIPLIFYNDPYPTAESRVVYWISQNERMYPHCEFHHLRDIFTMFNTIIEDPHIRPYISLLRPPLQLDGDNAATDISLDLLQFRLRNKVPPVMFRLFEFFYGNLCKEISIGDISQRVFDDACRRDSVYSYVSRLKKYIKADPLIKFDIIRSSMGRYQMIAC